jgi:hypothetical protein
MSERPQLDLSQLPSRRELTLASAGATVIALLLLVVAVMPAEWGIDPTGVGRVLGLTQVGEMKQQVTETPEDGVYAKRFDSLSVTLTPGQGTEVKAVMRAGDAMDFSWKADAPVFFEFHGDPKGKPGSAFVSYEKATKQHSDGHFEADFEGKHGWYWRNETTESLTVQLRASGVYASLAGQ